MLASTIKLGERAVAIEIVVASVNELTDGTALYLSDAERRRVAEIRHEARRRAVGASLALARLVASRRLGLAPTRVPMGRFCSVCGARDHGRPIVDGADFSMSVSRSFEWAAVAIAKDPVGVDIEPLSRNVRAGDLYPVCTGAERRWLRGLQHPEPLRLWVLKEAIGKAIGEGIVAAHRWGIPVEAESRLEGVLSGTSTEGTAWTAALVPASTMPVVAAVATADPS